VGSWHIFRVRRDGGIAVPPPEQRKDPRRITRFELVRREAVAALLATVALLALAMLFPAPIAAPLGSATPATGEGQAPWFFLWVQQLLRLGNPFIWGVLVPGSILLFLALIPYILPRPKNNELGAWFPPSNRLARAISAAILALLVGLTLLALLQ
jgi:quinol-cytochrome oxidoreductase complex cytochrome b subunit